jgi:hypothetical protein
MKEEYSSYRFSEDFHLVTGEKKLDYEIVEAVMSFLCFYPLLIFISLMFNYDNAGILQGMLLIIAIMVMVYVRKKIKRLILFIAAYVVIAIIGALSISSGLLTIFYFIFLLGYGISFINRRFKNINSFWRFNSLVLMNAFQAVLYCFTLGDNFASLRKLVFIVSTLNLMISIVYFHFSSANKLLRWEKYSEAKYTRNMKTMNVMFSIIIVLIIGAVIFIATKAGVFRWLDSASRNIFNGISEVMNMDIKIQKEVMDAKESTMFKPPELENLANNSSTIFSFFGLFMKFIFSLAAIVSIIFVVIAVFQILYKLFIRTLSTDEAAESMFSAKDIANNIKKSIKKPVLSLRKAIYKDNKDKLRKLYFQAVMNYKKKGVSVEKWNTPSEIEANISLNNKVEFSGITDFYEKFRYTQEEPSDDEVRGMKRRISEVNKKGK